LFTTSALYQNGYRITADPKTLPPVFFDAYKIPENERSDKFKWFAVLTWVGRRPNPKYGATKVDLMECPHYRSSMVPQSVEQVTAKKTEEAVDYMKMGLVKEIRKNGAIACVKEEGEEKEQKFFIPGWSYTHFNSTKVKFLTTTQGIGLGIGDLVNFYIDPNVIAKPYDAVACNVDVLKHADVPKPPTEKKVRKKSTMSTSSSKSGKGKKPHVNWKNFLLKAALPEEEPEGEEKEREKDPDGNLRKTMKTLMTPIARYPRTKSTT